MPVNATSLTVQVPFVGMAHSHVTLLVGMQTAVSSVAIHRVALWWM